MAAGPPWEGRWSPGEGSGQARGEREGQAAPNKKSRRADGWARWRPISIKLRNQPSCYVLAAVKLTRQESYGHPLPPRHVRPSFAYFQRFF